jgi:tetratricopeptide (TPR) repeat protein
MQYAQPQSEISEIFEELDVLSAQDAKNQILMQRYKNKAKKIQEIDPVWGYMILGFISCLERDIENMHFYYTRALKLRPELLNVYLNYTGCLSRLGFYSEATKYAEKAYNMDRSNKLALDKYIAGALLLGKINHAHYLIQKWNKLCPQEPHSFYEQIKEAIKIMEKYQLTDEDVQHFFQVASDFLSQENVYIDSKVFEIQKDGKEKWIHYEYTLSVSPDELPALEAELNIRLSELPSKIFDAVEIDIVSSEPITDKPKGMTEIILANDGLMESIRIAQEEMREGLLIPVIN